MAVNRNFAPDMMNFSTNNFGAVGTPVGTVLSTSSSDFRERMNSASTGIFEELVSSHKALENRNASLVHALGQAQYAAELAAERQRHLEQQVASLRTILDRDGFLVVVIDGHDLIFKNDLLRDGVKGGQQAAVDLDRIIRDWAVRTIYDCPPALKVVVRLFADVKGLAHACYRAGVTISEDVVVAFLSGFSQSKELFDVVDVGGEVDTINTKIGAFFRLHLYDYNCRQVLLGYSQNEHHTRMLHDLSSCREAPSRISLIQIQNIGPDTNPVQLVYNKMQIFDVFRQSKTSIRNSGRPDFGMQANLDLTIEPLGPIPILPLQAKAPIVHSVARSLEPSDHHKTPSLSSLGGLGGWSKIASKAAALPFTDLTRPQSNTKVEASDVMQNRHGQRIDPPMEFHHDSISQVKKPKYCNQHYIGKGCCHWQAGNGACPHRHDEVLNKDQLKWLRVIARETVCRKGTRCMDVDCIYGHHCPYPKRDNTSACTNGPECRFPPEMHNMDTKVVKHHARS